jgi:hypothetical protein
MLDEKELFRKMDALEAHDPRLPEKIEALRGQTNNEEILALLDNLAARVAGSRLSPWLPRGAERKLIMFGICVVAVLGAVYGQSLSWLFLLLLPSVFSPRAMGEMSGQIRHERTSAQ